MKILIIEDEIHLAHSIAKELSALKYVYYINTDYNHIIKELNNKDFDMLLLSTNTFGQKSSLIIKKYKHINIILLNSYNNYDYMVKSIEAGANDYILKPFMMNELIRKIKTLDLSSKFEKNIKILDHNIKQFNKLENEEIDICDEYPYFIDGNLNLFYEKLLISNIGKKYKFNISLEKNSKDILDKLNNQKIDEVTILANSKDLKQDDFKNLKNQIIKKGYKVILTVNTQIIKINAKTIYISRNNIDDRVITINDFIKNTILRFQDKYSDTKIAELLGVSRKNLWEKRKKFDIKK